MSSINVLSLIVDTIMNSKVDILKEQLILIANKQWNFFQQNKVKEGKTVVIFHCEFSKHRGPSCCRHFRQFDRESNTYPSLTFPDVFIMDGGYHLFYQKFPQFCTPDAYVSMWDPKFSNECKERHKEFKKSWSSPKARRLLHRPKCHSYEQPQPQKQEDSITSPPKRASRSSLNLNLTFLQNNSEDKGISPTRKSFLMKRKRNRNLIFQKLIFPDTSSELFRGSGGGFEGDDNTLALSPTRNSFNNLSLESCFF